MGSSAAPPQRAPLPLHRASAHDAVAGWTERNRAQGLACRTHATNLTACPPCYPGNHLASRAFRRVSCQVAVANAAAAPAASSSAQVVTSAAANPWPPSAPVPEALIDRLRGTADWPLCVAGGGKSNAGRAEVGKERWRVGRKPNVRQRKSWPNRPPCRVDSLPSLRSIIRHTTVLAPANDSLFSPRQVASDMKSTVVWLLCYGILSAR